jgi:uncharacterized protein YegL
VQSSPGGRLEFAFDPSTATLSRPENGNDLIFETDGGGRLVIAGFFETGAYPLPEMAMPDGVVVSAVDFIAANNPDLSVETAAGPAPNGGGTDAYEADAGALVDSVDRLGALGSEGWDTSRPGLVMQTQAVFESPFPSTWDTGAFSDFGVLAEAALREGGLSVHRDSTLTAGSDGIAHIGFGDISAIRVEGVEGGVLWEYGKNADGSPNPYVLVGYRDLDGDGAPDDLDGDGDVTEDGDGLLRVTLDAPANLAPGTSANVGVTVDLLNPAHNVRGEADLVVSGIPLAAVEGDGEVIAADFGLTVADDSPSNFVFDADGTTEVSSGYAVHGEWGLDYGADGAAAAHGLQLSVSHKDADGNEVGIGPLDVVMADGKAVVSIPGCGTMTLNGDGSFDFRSLPDMEGDFRFTLTGRDADGDVVSGDFDLRVEPHTPGEITGGNVSVSDAFLPGGTRPDDSQLTRTLRMPEGWKVDPASGDWADRGDGIYTLEGAYGHLTYNAKANTLSYTLDRPGAHKAQGADAVSDNFDGKVSLVDGGGNHVNMPVNVTISDDVPEVALGGAGAAYSGMDYTGHWSAVFGADGPAAFDPDDPDGLPPLLVRIVDGQGNTLEAVPVTPGTPASIPGYGVLTLNADHTFTFRPAAGLDADVRLLLQAVDADGDVASSGEPLLIDVDKPAGPDAEAITAKDGKVFDEARLSWGTSPNPDDLTGELSLPDGYRVNTGGWTDEGDGIFSLDAGNGTLTYVSASNTLTYTLNAARTEGSADDGRDLFSLPDVTINVEDAYGNQFEMPVRIEVRDDAPTAWIGGDGHTVTGGSRYAGLGFWHSGEDREWAGGGLEMSLRAEGPDGTLTELGTYSVKFDEPVVIPGYGKMTFREVGYYHFETEAGKAGSNLTLTLIATDGDGDVTASSGFVIQITDANGPGMNYLGGNDDERFSESWLPKGTAAGEGALVRPVALPEGYTIDTGADGWTDQGGGIHTLNGAYGVLTYDAKGNTLTYTLTGAPAVAGQGANVAEDRIPQITLRDAEGNGFELPVRIGIDDDLPEATFTGAGAEVLSGRAYEGRWGVNFGADGERAGGGLELEVKLGDKVLFAGAVGVGAPVDVPGHGTLTLNADGTYALKTLPDVSGDLRFTLYATDGDGDRASSGDGFVVKVARPEGPGIDYLGKGAAVDESGLPGGTGGGDAAVPIELPAGYSVDTDGWKGPDGDGKYALDGDYGRLVYDPDSGALTYVLDKAGSHPDQGADRIQDNISGITLKDEFGNTCELGAKIGIVDDVPVVSLGAGARPPLIESGAEYRGVWSVAYGADGAADDGALVVTVAWPGASGAFTAEVTPGASMDVEIDGARYGKLTVNGDGTFAFEAAPGLNGSLNISLAAADSDGDVSGTGEFTLNVVDPNGPGIPYIGFGQAPFEEANLANGTNPDTAALTRELPLPDGYTLDTGAGGWVPDFIGPDNHIYRLESPNGVLAYDSASRTLTYTLKDNMENAPDSDLGRDVFTGLAIRDDKGGVHTLNARIDIADDSPVAVLTPLETTPVNADGGYEIPSGGVLTGGYGLKFGADGAAAEKAVLLTVTDENGVFSNIPISVGGMAVVSVGGTDYGMLTLNPDGTFSFRANPNLAGGLRIELAVTDQDGDSSHAGFDLTLTKPAGLADFTGFDFDGAGEILTEASLADGTLADGDLTRTVSLPADPNHPSGGPYGLDTTGWTSNPDGTYTRTVAYGTLTYDPDAGELSYTLTGPAANTGGMDPDQAKDAFAGLILKDALGNTHETGGSVTFRDDAPTFSGEATVDTDADAADDGDDYADIESGGSVSGNFDRPVYGADGGDFYGDSLLHVVLGDPDAPDGTARISVSLGVDMPVYIGGVFYGTFHVLSGGIYSFKAAPDRTGDLTFTLEIHDADGDTAMSGAIKIELLKPEYRGPDHMGGGDDEKFSEKNLPDGTTPNAGALTKPIALPLHPKDGTYEIDTSSGWQRQPDGSWTRAGAYGRLTYDYPKYGSPTLTYTLDRAADNDKGDAGKDLGETELISLRIKDDAGNTYDLQARIDIADDNPEIRGFTSADTTGKGLVFNGDGWHEVGAINFGFGADDAGGAKGVSINGVAATYDEAAKTWSTPKVSIGPDGKVYYKLDMSADQGVIDLDVRVTDADGDSVSVNGADFGIVFSVAPTLSVGVASVDEAGGKDLVFTVSQSDAIGTDVSVGWSVTLPASGVAGKVSYADLDASRFGDLGVTAVDNGDGTWTLTGKATVLAGDTSAGIHLPVFDDAILEGDETLQITISNPTNANIGAGTATGTIVDDEDDVPVVIKPALDDDGKAAVAIEGKDLVFELHQSGADGADIVSSGDTAISWSVTVPATGAAGVVGYADLNAGGFTAAGISAKDNGDGTWTLTGTATIPAGKSSAEIRIPTYDDEIYEYKGESLVLKLTGVTNSVADATFPGGAGDISLTGVILDDDARANDPAGTALTLALQDADARGSAADGASMTVDLFDSHAGFASAAFDPARVPSTAGGNLVWQLSSDGKTWTGSQNGAPVVIVTLDGIDAAGNVTVGAKLLEPMSHGSSFDLATIGGIEIKATDANGKTVNGGITVTITDDAPEVAAFEGAPSQVINRPAPYSVGRLEFDFGADDGANRSIALNYGDSGDSVRLAYNPATGAWTSADGKVSLVPKSGAPGEFDVLYTPAPGEIGSVGISFTITDSDGDSVRTGKIGFTVTPSDLPTGQTTVAVDESYLTSGSHQSGGGAEKAAAANAITLTPNEVATLKVHGVVGGVEGDYAVKDGLVVYGDHGYVTFRVDGGNVGYTYTLTGNYSHAPNSGPDQAAAGAEQFALTIAGTPVGAISVTIEDDAPLLGFDTGGNVTLGQGMNFTASGALDYSPGADNADASSVTVGIRSDYTSGGSTGTSTVSCAVPLDGTHVSVNTSTGLLTLWYEKGEIVYTYEAQRGHRNDTDRITFTVTDSDGDSASANFTVTLSENVPGATARLDEAGLEFGSHAAGHGEAGVTVTLGEVALAPNATSLDWDLGHMPKLLADGDRNGKYEEVKWVQEGDSLKGYADGQLALEVTPDFENGRFTGELTVTLHSAVQHGGPGTGTDQSLSLTIPFTQNSPGGAHMSSAVGIVIRDDAPAYDTKAPAVAVDVTEGGNLKEDVVLVLDVSSSISGDQFNSYIKALHSLVQAYVDNNVIAKFSVVTFGADAWVIPELQSVSAEVLLSMLTPTTDTRELLHYPSGGTNYTRAFDAVIPLLDKHSEDISNNGYHQKLYFVTDGAQNAEQDEFMENWVPYLNTHDELTAYGIGIGSDFNNPNSASSQGVAKVVGGIDNVVRLSDYSHLAEQLVSLIEGAQGQIMDGFASADYTGVQSVVVTEGPAKGSYAMTQTTGGGLRYASIPVGNGVTMNIYEDGTYRVSAGNIDEDLHITFHLKVTDADGDSRVSQSYNLTVHDRSPEAYDNTGYLEENGYGVRALGDFYTTTSSTSTAKNALSAQGWSFSGESVQMTGALGSAFQTPPPNPYAGDMTHGFVFMNNPYYLRPGVSGELDFMKNTFGVSTLNNLYTLIHDVGVRGTQADMNAGLGTSTFDMSAIARTFTPLMDSDAKIVFEWSGRFDRLDAAWCIVRDASGNIVAKQVLYQSATNANNTGTTTYASGLAEIGLPSTGNGPYTVVIVSQQIGNATGTDTQLYVGPVTLLEDCDYTGNVITDPGPDGMVDEVWDQAVMGSVTYNGQTKIFSAGSDHVKFDSPEGTLVVYKDGTYMFSNDSSAEDSLKTFSYRLTDRDGDWSDPATVTLVPEIAPVTAYDNVSGIEEQHVSLLGGFSARFARSGWVAAGGTDTPAGNVTRFFNENLRPAEGDSLLDAYRDGRYMCMNGSSQMSAANTTQVTGSGITLGGFINTLGLHDSPYSPGTGRLAGDFISRSFTSTGGEIRFDYVLASNQAGADKGDAAIWILQDANGRHIASGTIAQLSAAAGLQSASGICSVALPYTDNPTGYKLVLGTLQVGSGTGATPYLYIDAVVEQEYPCHFRGNVLTQPDEEGRVDIMNESTFLYSVTYQGTEYVFGANRQLTIPTDSGGKLVISSDGSYSYRDALGSDGSGANEDFTYTLHDASDNSSSAALHVRGSDYVYQGTAEGEIIDLQAHASNDLVRGGGGNDVVYAGSGKDLIYGDAGNDTIRGGAGEDTVYGGAGEDVIYGDAGRDSIYGGAGNDILYGGAGNDLIYGGAGNNTLYGGAGNDTFAWDQASLKGTSDHIMDFSEGDRLRFSDLLDARAETLDDFLRVNVSLDPNRQHFDDRTLLITIRDGELSKDVEITFEQSNAAFDRFINTYNGAADETAKEAALNSFLRSISEG